MAGNENSILDAYKNNQTTENIDTTRKLRVGIIGCGGIAGAHMREYLRMPDVEIVAGADIVPGKAEKFMAERGVATARCYTDHKEMLDNEELDAVSICTYNRTHAECTVYALAKGVNVLLEKPLCVTMDEAKAICKAEKESGKVLSIGFQPRFDPNMQMIKKIVESGELGRIYYIQTGGGRRRGIPAREDKTSFIEDRTAGIGAMGDIGCYSLDMVLNAIGYPKPLTVSGYTSAYFGKNPEYWTATGMPAHFAELFGVDDFAAGFIRLEGDIILDFRISWAMHIDTPGDTVILGTKGALRIPSTDCWNGSVGGPMKIYHEVAGEQVCTEIPIKKADERGIFYLKVRSFLDAVKNGGAAPVSTSQIIINQAIISGIVDSNKLGREIEIEIPRI